MPGVKRRNFLQMGAVFLMLPAPGWGAQESTEGPVIRIYIGCFTNASGESVPADFGTHRGPNKITEGIYQFTFNLHTGQSSQPELAAKCSNPVNLIMHSNGRTLYACRGQSSRIKGQNIITAYRIQSDGSLSELNTLRSGGYGPTVGDVSQNGRFLLTTNFASHSVVSFELNPDGSLKRRAAMIGEEPRGEPPTPLPPGAKAEPADELKASKPHAVVLSKTQNFAIASEILTNQCHVLRFDSDTGALTSHQQAPDFPHAGPRHLAWHPDYRFLFTSGEENSTITSWRWDESKGELRALENITVLPKGYTGKNYPADVVVHPSGYFVYVTNRGAGALAGFHINQETGGLTPLGHARLGSPACWGMVFAPGGHWAIAASQISDEILIYRVNTGTGELVATDRSVSAVLPTCLRWTWV